MDEPAAVRLATWDELRAYLEATRALRPRADGAVQVAVAGDDAPVAIRAGDVQGSPWIELVAVLGVQVRSVPPTPVLRKNFELAMGTLGMVDGNLQVRQLLPLDGLLAADLEDVLALMAQAIEAARAH